MAFTRGKDYGDVFTPRTIHLPKNTVCAFEGCGKPAHGKTHCRMHKQEKVITKEDQAKLRSMCCDAQCTYGQRHEYGKQYCSKCKEPCIWRAP